MSETFESGYSFSAVSFMSDGVTSIYSSNKRNQDDFNRKGSGHSDLSPECASPLITKHLRAKREEEARRKLFRNRADSFDAYLTDEDINDKERVLDFSYINNDKLSTTSSISSYDESDVFCGNVHSFPQQNQNIIRDESHSKEGHFSNDAVLVTRSFKQNSFSPEQYKTPQSFSENFVTI